MLPKRKSKEIQPRRVTQPVQRTSVFSYHSNRSAPETARARYEVPADRRRGLERLKHTPTLIAGIVIVGTLLYASLLGNQPRVQVLASSSGQPLQRSDEIYADFVSKQLGGSVLNKSKLTFNAQPLVESLQKEFPEVDSAIVTLPLIGHRPIVRIAVASPSFVLATSQGAYYVSDKGMPLVKVSDIANKPENIPTVTDETNLPIEAGKQVLPSDTVMFIAQLLAHLSSTKIAYESITLPLEANEVRVKPQGASYYIRLNALQDARTQVGTYLAVKNQLKESREQPKEYIDVRVEERAYYK